MIKQLFFALKCSCHWAFNREHFWVSNDRVWIILSVFYSVARRAKKAFSGLSPSSLFDKQLLCSTHTVGRPLTGRRLRVSALTHWKISHAERKDGSICLNV